MKKALTLLLVSVVSLGSLKAQKYKEMMQDPSVNFYDVVAEAEAYFAENGIGKGSGHKPFMRWVAQEESHYYPSGDRSQVDPYFVSKAYMSFINNNPNASYKRAGETWKDLGPYNANHITSHYSAGIGRVECLWVNPKDTNHIFMGSRSGGFWKTKDGGKTWKNTTDFLIASGVNTITVSPTNSDTVLINVRNGGNGTSHGIYRSIDGGDTWELSEFNPENLKWGGLGTSNQIYKIAFHPRKPKVIFIGTNTGLYRSNNQLKDWAQFQANFYVTDIEFHPIDDNHIYIFNNRNSSNRGYVWVSTTMGSSFKSSALANNSQACFLAVSANEPDWVYAASSSGIWKSTDKGETFNFIKNPDENCQGFAVSDLDAKSMLYGYVDLEYSSNGGTIFNQVTNWSNSKPDRTYVHADLRTAECINGVFYVGTDGYLAKSKDGFNWFRLNDGTGIRENYCVGVSQSNWQLHMLGSQDNGTSILNNEGWIEWNGGDGMEALARPLNDDWMIGSWQYGTRNATLDGGQTRIQLSGPESGSGDWVAPMLYDPNNQDRIYHFMTNVYVSDNFGISWRTQGQPNMGKIQVAAIAKSNSGFIALSQRGDLKLSSDSGKTFSNISPGLPGYNITDIAFDPQNHNTILVSYNRYLNDNQKIYISHNQGKNWQNITGNLGNMPILTIDVDHSDSSYIYVGTEIGVFVKSMEGKTWELFNDKLPNVTVRDLEIQFASNTLKAATWGRGLWEAPLKGRANYPQIQFIYNEHGVSEISPKKGVDQNIRATINYSGTLSSVFVRWAANGMELDSVIQMKKTGSEWISTRGIKGQKINTPVRFKVYAVGDNNDTSVSHMLMYTTREFKHCAAAGSSNTGADYIDRVALNGYEKTSTKSTYSDFTNEYITLKTNTSYWLEIDMNYHFDQDTTGAWIDYDGNAEFEKDEQIIMGSLTNDHKSRGKFRVPVDANVGDTVRLRVRSQYYNEDPFPCGIRTGEVEDYSIIIAQGPGAVNNEFGDGFSILPNPSGGQFLVDFGSSQNKLNLNITDLSGKLIYTSKIENQTQSLINIEQKPGIYLLNISNGTETANFKLVVE